MSSNFSQTAAFKSRSGAHRVAPLTQIREQRCSLGAGVQERYTAWLERHEHELHGHPRCEDLSPFWSRLSIMALKFSMLLQMAKDAEAEITLDALNRSLALVDFLKRALVHLFAEEFAFTKDEHDRQKVLRHVRAKPGITYRDLMRACSLPKFQMDRVLDTLTAEERVQRRSDGRKVSLWPSEDNSDVSVASLPVSATGTDNEHPLFRRVK